MQTPKSFDNIDNLDIARNASTTFTFSMGKILQKKKNRSGLSKARAKNNRLKSGHKKVNVLGNAIIAENWYAEFGSECIRKANNHSDAGTETSL